MTKRQFTDDELSCVGTVYTVDAIGPCHSILYLCMIWLSITVVEETRLLENLVRDGLERPNDILITARGCQDLKGLGRGLNIPLGSAAHVPCFVHNLFVIWQKLVKILNGFGVFL